MPSRTVTLAIFLFWLAALGWAFQREVWPRLRAGEPPQFRFEAEDELAERVILWEVFQNGVSIGSAQTRILPHVDQTFDLRTDLSFRDLTILTLRVKRISDSYRVKLGGELVAFAATIKGEMPTLSSPWEIDIKGDVENGILTPTVAFTGLPLPKDVLTIEPVDVSRHGSVLSVLHPQNKVPGLYAGRSWKVPVFNPLAATASVFKRIDMSTMVAVVERDEIDGPGGPVPCWRIDVGHPGKQEPVSRTWVRIRDDLVLQMEASYEGTKMLLKRTGVK